MVDVMAVIWYAYAVKPLDGNKMVDHLDVVEASPVGAARTASPLPS